MNLLAPITHMDKLACIGLNYSGHCQEQGIPTPESPVVFSKFPSNIIGPRDNILLPQISDVSRRRGREGEEENAAGSIIEAWDVPEDRVDLVAFGTMYF